MNVKDWTDDRLIEEYKDLHQQIYVIDCFGTRDLYNIEVIEKELYNRGYRAVSHIELIKTDEPDEEEIPT